MHFLPCLSWPCMIPWLHFWQFCIKCAPGCFCDWNKQDYGFVLVLFPSLTLTRSVQQHSLEHPKLFSNICLRGFSERDLPGVVRGEGAINTQGNLPSGRSVHRSKGFWHFGGVRVSFYFPQATSLRNSWTLLMEELGCRRPQAVAVEELTEGQPQVLPRSLRGAPRSVLQELNGTGELPGCCLLSLTLRQQMAKLGVADLPLCTESQGGSRCSSGNGQEGPVRISLGFPRSAGSPARPRSPLPTSPEHEFHVLAVKHQLQS